MLRESQAGDSCSAPPFSSSLKAATAPCTTCSVLDRRRERRVLRPPERHENPARAVGLLPGRERTPHAGARELHFLVADERRPIDRRPMILAAEVARVEQPDAALLAGMRRVFLALVLEHRTRGIQVEIALAQPVRIGRRVPVGHLERFGGGFCFTPTIACPKICRSGR